jgi:hypothetical protein
MYMRILVLAVLVFSLAAFAQTVVPPDASAAPTATVTGIGYQGDWYQVKYMANLPAGDSVLNLTNTGRQNGLDPAGRICANVYTFDANEELISCCACPITPNGLRSLSARGDLISNTLTPGVPPSITVKLVADQKFSPAGALICNASTPTAASLARGLRAWGTTIHALPTTPVTYGVTETEFSFAELSVSELAKVTSYCAFIQNNGSGFGLCNSCRIGALGAETK